MTNDFIKQQQAEDLLRSLGYVPILWHIDDVRQCAQESDLGQFTDAECLEILDTARKYHDAEWGISWEVLRFHTEDYAASR